MVSTRSAERVLASGCMCLALVALVGLGIWGVDSATADETDVAIGSESVPGLHVADSEDDLEALGTLESAREDDAVSEEPEAMGNTACVTGGGCMWFFQDRVGEKQRAYPFMAGLGWLFYEGYTFRSAVNKFNNRRFGVRSALTGVTRCMDPGEKRLTLPVMSLFRVGNTGTRCP